MKRKLSIPRSTKITPSMIVNLNIVRSIPRRVRKPPSALPNSPRPYAAHLKQHDDNEQHRNKNLRDM